METLLISLGLALLFLALGIPLMLGKVKRNSLYGARFPATMADGRVWDVVNRKMGFVFVAGGAAAGIVDVLAVAGVVTRDVGLYVTGALVVYVLIASVWLWRYSERVARDTGVSARDMEVGRTTPVLVAIGCLAVAIAGVLSAFSTPNPWLGFRVPATFADPAVWHQVNLKAGLTLAVLSGVFGFMFLGLRNMTEGERKRLFSGLFIGWLISIVVVAIAGSVFANSLVR
ncbi:MAG TPA: SdpI family protein [Candidatus Deferrimicrobium sp.]|nr:SdpI family protein [Candidatus Deferrimicrobium sp.]